MCTKHMDWADGSTMTAHATELLQPGQPVSARMVIAGEATTLPRTLH